MSGKSKFLRRVEKHSPDIFEKTPLERNQVVYVPRFLCQASLPKNLENISEWRRSINNHDYTVLSPSSIGVPGGAYSRLILIQINTLAKLKKKPELNLGSNYSEFMKWMGLKQSGGGDKGNINAFKEHFIRCINCVIHTESRTGKNVEYSVTAVIDQATVRNINDWNWEPHLSLSNAFFEASQKSVPTDLGALICLGPGTLRMDIFNFLVSRLFYLKRETLIPWREIEAMFSTPQTLSRSFRQSFKIALDQALQFYQDANVTTSARGLILKPSRMLIQPIK